MQIKANKPKTTKYYSKTQGLYSINPCTKSCTPTENPTPHGPTPKQKIYKELTPLKATKLSNHSNQWILNGVIYKDFNSMWVNRLKHEYAVLRTPNEA